VSGVRLKFAAAVELEEWADSVGTDVSLYEQARTAWGEAFYAAAKAGGVQLLVAMCKEFGIELPEMPVRRRTARAEFEWAEDFEAYFRAVTTIFPEDAQFFRKKANELWEVAIAEAQAEGGDVLVEHLCREFDVWHLDNLGTMLDKVDLDD
jgi:hypothetical protein